MAEWDGVERRRGERREAGSQGSGRRRGEHRVFRPAPPDIEQGVWYAVRSKTGRWMPLFVRDERTSRPDFGYEVHGPFPNAEEAFAASDAAARAEAANAAQDTGGK